MKNITLSADEDLIEEARSKARSENTTLNSRFREWLEEYTFDASAAEERLRRVFDEISAHAVAGKTFTRDEMNER